MTGKLVLSGIKSKILLLDYSATPTLPVTQLVNGQPVVFILPFMANIRFTHFKVYLPSRTLWPFLLPKPNFTLAAWAIEKS